MKAGKKLNLRAAAEAVDCVEHSITFGALCEAHEYARPFLGIGPRLRKWREAFADLPAWDLTAAMIHKAAAAMHKAGYSPASVNRDVSAVGTVYLWAITKRRIAPPGFRSPTRDVPRVPEAIRRVSLSDKEIAALRALAARAFPDKRFGLYVAMLADSGCRKSEILERTWEEFDIAAGRIVLPTSKNGDPRTLFFGPEAMALAARVKPRNASGLIFHSPRDKTTPINYRASWRCLVKMIDRKDLHQHDLRHAAAADLLRRGAGIAVAAQVMGHRSHVMLTRRYGHLDVKDLAAVQHSRFNVARQ